MSDPTAGMDAMDVAGILMGVQAEAFRRGDRVLVPAVVDSYDATVRQAIVTLSDGGAMSAQTLIGAVTPGERVMVAFEPPRGVFIDSLVTIRPEDPPYVPPPEMWASVVSQSVETNYPASTDIVYSVTAGTVTAPADGLGSIIFTLQARNVTSDRIQEIEVTPYNQLTGPGGSSNAWSQRSIQDDAGATGVNFFRYNITAQFTWSLSEGDSWAPQVKVHIGSGATTVNINQWMAHALFIPDGRILT